MKKIIIFCLSFCALHAIAYCGQLSKIELTDGSVINGEIVSLVNGSYTINTAAFGEIKIGSAKVAKIESVNYTLPPASVSPAVATNNLSASEVSTFGQTLMKNPENAAIFKGLSSNPGLQEMAEDSQIQAAAKSGDIQALMKNPKFMNIVNSPEVQEAVKKIKQ